MTAPNFLNDAAFAFRRISEEESLMPRNRTIWTIGHGLAEIDKFLSNLQAHEIEVVVDIRSSPSSTRAPQFNRGELSRSLESESIRYVFMGAELGGRPPEESYYDQDGYVLYRRLAESKRFQRGLSQLERGAALQRVAVVCSESDPAKCHASYEEIAMARLDGFEIKHILNTGRTIAFDDALVTEVGLPGFSEEDQWRSLVQVRQEPRPSDFSGD